ncbi:unnamed protein product [Albugo candida]|uniref:UBL3-like ubiquitin domain-containing protein n=1 Tax=Albugo candida TaxID=65357 RepID=A0A024G2G5_9STRA|nr:unnamed protein product [Albugo candida]|eukprot:CCI40940.1 unnamed protein product [Albugo candida]
MQENDLALRFLFANHEKYACNSPYATCNWHWFPESYFATALADRAQDVSQIRFICMGRGLLQDRQTLSSARIPSFPTHPTPINVVVRSNVLAAKKDSTARNVAAIRTATSPIDCNCVMM